MGVSERTSFTNSSSTTGSGGGNGSGTLQFASWVAFDLGAWDLSWGWCWFLRPFWSCFGVLKQQPIWTNL